MPRRLSSSLQSPKSGFWYSTHFELWHKFSEIVIKNNAYHRFLAISVHFPRKYNFNFVMTLEVFFVLTSDIFWKLHALWRSVVLFLGRSMFFVFSKHFTKVTQKIKLESFSRGPNETFWCKKTSRCRQTLVKLMIITFRFDCHADFNICFVFRFCFSYAKSSK